MPTPREEDFRPTSGRALGVVGLVVAVGVVVLGLLDGGGDLPLWVVAAAVLAAVLIWVAMLRPRVWVGEGRLVLRSMLRTVEVPLAGVDSVVLRQVLVVLADGRRYTSPALGKARRALVRADHGRPARGRGAGVGSMFGMGGDLGGGLGGMDGADGGGGAQPRAQGVDYAEFVESRLVDLTTRARREAATRPGSPEARAAADGVRREVAWPEVALLAASLGATLVLGLLGI